MNISRIVIPRIDIRRIDIRRVLIIAGRVMRQVLRDRRTVALIVLAPIIVLTQ